jgi:hypothetical protein
MLQNIALIISELFERICSQLGALMQYSKILIIEELLERICFHLGVILMRQKIALTV